MIYKTKPEILAPAGDINALKSAVYCGADAVYLGLEDFNARKKAPNFTVKNIGETVRFCHFYKTKVYVTLNTNVRQSEIDDVRSMVLALKDAKVDAVIVTDLAIVKAIKELAPQIPVHLSTQAGVCNLQAAQFAQSLGADRVVLARETSLADVKAIRDGTNLEIEYFVQGALCVAFSGKCLLSSLKSGESGNRGRCLQPCRLEYTCGDKCGYLLSPKDMSLAGKLNDLAAAGVTSFKIEGRLRSAEYVANAVRYYREALDKGVLNKKSLDNLKIAFNRGDYTEGYLSGNSGIIFPKLQSNVGLAVGKVVSVTDKTAVVVSERPLKNGDGFKMLFAEKEIAGGSVNIIKQNKNHFTIECKGAKVGASFNLTKTQEEQSVEKPLYKTAAKFWVSECGEATLELRAEGQISNSKFTVEKAKTVATSEEEIAGQIKKTADVGFEISEIGFENASGWFIPKSVLNGARREAVGKLFDAVANSFNGTFDVVNNQNCPKTIINKAGIHNNLVAVAINSADKLSKTVLSAKVVVYAPFDFDEQAAISFIEKAKAINDAKIYLRLPPQADGRDVSVFENLLKKARFDGIFAENYYALTLAEKFGLKVFLGGLLNVWNKAALTSLEHEYFMPSTELCAKEISSVFGKNAFVYAYGRMPLMNFKHCPIKALYKNDCANCKYKGTIFYTDRKDFKFPIVRRRAANCNFDLLNCVKTDVRKRFDELDFNYYVDLTTEDAENVDEIVMSFLEKRKGVAADVTYGHLFRGAF